MSCPCSFPPSLQLDCLLELFRLVRSGEIVSAKAHALQHVGCLLGSLGSYLDQSPDPAPVGATSNDLACTLEEAAAECEATFGAMQASDGATAINPDNLAMLLNFIMLLLKQFLAK